MAITLAEVAYIINGELKVEQVPQPRETPIFHAIMKDGTGDITVVQRNGKQLESEAKRNIATGYCCNCCNKIAIAPGCGSGCGHGALPRVNGFHWL